ncbi:MULTISPECIES: hypothetical protein [Brucella]|uniref:Uncharacterized protein n=1 Tax=Brucella inopinata TaxID=1218315 RepID=A0AAW7B250_9HYPH|nr:MULTISPECIES: hypothetical protein [Brucella]APY14208.1 hypothetical protein BKD02_07930 [Brucella sp. 09RB8910]MDL2332867.1 hypothetical protein [Brucella inopinata]MRN48100.1 hypothetical protein [Brucella sp. 10RB9212]
MLSHCLRDMRTELEKVSFRSGTTVEFSAAEIQSYILALITYERMVRQMERQLSATSPVPPVSGDILTFPPRTINRPQLTVIHGDGGDVA